MGLPRPALHFSKMHGAGNDFVVIDLRGGRPAPDAALCRAMADRHTGIGCDQLLTIEAPRTAGARASYRIWNANGSSSQQCGNGARCVAAWLLRDATRGGVDADANADADNEANAGAGPDAAADLLLDSPAGSHAVTVLDAASLRIDMGAPQFAPQAVPLDGYIDAQDVYAFDVDGGQVVFGAVSMGNPHLVIEVDDIATAPVAELGARLQGHDVLPQSGNIGFVQVLARDRIALRVFERGVGETLACGSGACAAVAVLVRRGRIDRDVAVQLPGGTLQVSWPDDTASIAMTGPATFVFEGEWLQ